MVERADSRIARPRQAADPAKALPGPEPDQWDALAAAGGNLFATRTWQECWWRHFGDGEAIVLADDEQSPTALVALQRSGRLLRRLRLVGHGYSDLLGVVAAEHDDPNGVVLVRKALDTARWDVFVAHDVPVDSGWCQALKGIELRRVASPVVRFQTDDWDEYLRGKSKNFREQLRRRARKLEASHAVEYRMATSDSVGSDFDTLFELHRRRWGNDAPFAAPESRRFHQDIGRVALERSWLRLWTLELDGTPVASLLGYRFAGADYFVQGGRDPAYDSWSVGSLLLFHTVRRAVEDGMLEYRLLRGDESYKSQLATDDRPVHSFAVAGTALGRGVIEVARRRERRRVQRSESTSL